MADLPPLPLQQLAPIAADLASGDTGTQRRAVAAGLGVVLPFVNAALLAKFGIGVSDGIMAGVIAFIGGYITQSALTNAHTKSNDKALALAATPQSAAADLSTGVK